MPRIRPDGTLATVAPGHRRGYAPSRKGALRRLLEVLLLWQDRASQRTRLAEMDDWQLRDLGLKRGEAIREAEKPFWLP